MTVERVVSSHNILTSSRRDYIELDTLNQRLLIALDGKGTAHFDSRPAIIRFLKERKRRDSHPDVEAYRSHFYVERFFHQ